ncbi:MAG TPA: rod shape-determining protein MreC [Patescibacteria group bacterium]|nr:rod shape-determining protein MreC [Patescibacteria group bacterium]
MRFPAWKNRLSFRKLLFPAFLLGAVFFVASLGLLKTVQRPLSAFGSSFRSLWFHSVAEDGSVLGNRTRMEERILHLLEKEASCQQLETEMQNVKQQLGFFDRRPLERIPASVLVQAPGPLNTFFIDRGSADGVEAGDPVVVAEGVLIGKVLKVANHHATVLSILDPSSRVAVAVLNRSHSLGLVQGMGGSVLALHFVPQEEPLAPEDLLVTSGLEPGMPSGLLVGIVNRVQADPSAPFQEGLIEPILDSKQYHFVSVLRSRPYD